LLDSLCFAAASAAAAAAAAARDYTDISIAVATPKGLVVPVLRSVDKLSFAEVEKVGGRGGVIQLCVGACTAWNTYLAVSPVGDPTKTLDYVTSLWAACR
jgi:hypothetical protein